MRINEKTKKEFMISAIGGKGLGITSQMRGSLSLRVD